MRHLNRGRKLNRTSSHRKALLRSLAASLFEHKKISTTEAKAKEVRPFAEQLITKAKRALIREQQGLLPEGQTIDIHNRRMVFKDIRIKAIVQELFDTIAPMVVDRPGGYTRIIKTGTRRGDGSKTAIIELVDWSAPQDGATSFKSKKKAKSRAKVKKEQKMVEPKEAVVAPVELKEEIVPVTPVTEEVVETLVVETAETAPEVIEEVVTEVVADEVAPVTTDDVTETPAEEGNKEVKE